MKPSFREEAFITKGIGTNGHKKFAVELSGKEWYALLAALERIAEESGSYSRIREMVVISEALRNQLRTRGF